MHPYPFWPLGSPVGLIIITALLTACAKEPPPNFYHQSGKMAQVVRCPVGEYEICLQQMSDACQESGYTIHEKVRQIKSGVWSDLVETLIVVQCNNPSK